MVLFKVNDEFEKRLAKKVLGRRIVGMNSRQDDKPLDCGKSPTPLSKISLPVQE